MNKDLQEALDKIILAKNYLDEVSIEFAITACIKSVNKIIEYLDQKENEQQFQK